MNSFLAHPFRFSALSFLALTLSALSFAISGEWEKRIERSGSFLQKTQSSCGASRASRRIKTPGGAVRAEYEYKNFNGDSLRVSFSILKRTCAGFGRRYREVRLPLREETQEIFGKTGLIGGTMSVKTKAEYIGDYQVELEHGPSGAKIVTDLPEDNGGQGRMFSPTDLFTASLASCILTIMAKMAERDNIDFKGSSIEIEKHMAENPRRVAKFIGRIKFKPEITEKQRKKLLACVNACPVHKSLHPEIKTEFTVC